MRPGVDQQCVRGSIRPASVRNNLRNIIGHRASYIAAADCATVCAKRRPASAARHGQRVTKCARPLAMAGHHARPACMASRAL
ncbi:hypothetical protein F511_47512 [Dorcoceras hygrometricum]|uniref:Uncharacterized protein n=1 Tax=Dorcoceras hygrometricum TaxID=472368 RepID=A0A2Z6ZXA2_9LAMI|nr:hypothetical protein F511_47512 [Dorcoceras hygrometricum]